MKGRKENYWGYDDTKTVFTHKAGVLYMVLFSSFTSIFAASLPNHIHSDLFVNQFVFCEPLFIKLIQHRDTTQFKNYTWIPQRQHTTDFKFAAALSDRYYSTENKRVEALKITNTKTEKVQLIEHIEALLRADKNNIVQVQDVNFDGYPDIWIFDHSGGAGPNDGNNYYLFNPKSKQFEYSQQLSHLTQVYIDSKTKTIQSAFRDGCCHHGGATYTFKGHKMDTLSTWNQQFGYSGIFIEDYYSQKEKGHWEDSLSYSVIPNQKITVRDTPSEKGKIIASIKPDQYNLNIIKENPLWFYVENTEVKKPYKGWIKKEKLFTKQRLPYSTETKKLKFYALGSKKSKQVYGIEVYNKKKKAAFQIIPIYKNLSFQDDLKISFEASKTLFQFGFADSEAFNFIKDSNGWLRPMHKKDRD